MATLALNQAVWLASAGNTASLMIPLERFSAVSTLAFVRCVSLPAIRADERLPLVTVGLTSVMYCLFWLEVACLDRRLRCNSHVESLDHVGHMCKPVYGVFLQRFEHDGLNGR